MILQRIGEQPGNSRSILTVSIAAAVLERIVQHFPERASWASGDIRTTAVGLSAGIALAAGSYATIAVYTGV